VFLSSSQVRDVRVPGLRLRSQRGLGPEDGDVPFMGQNLFMSSRARAFLQNLKPSRSRAGAVPRTLSQAELVEALVAYGRYDLSSLNRLRDEARAVAGPLKAERQFERLDDLIGTMLRTQDVDDVELSSRRAQAVARGEPFDPARIEALEQLGNHLLAAGLPAVPEDAANDVSVLATSGRAELSPTRMEPETSSHRSSVRRATGRRPPRRARPPRG
jgi:hypothetical protein